VGEAGYLDLATLSTDYWFIAPPTVPKAQIQILGDVLIKTVKDPEFLRWAKMARVTHLKGTCQGKNYPLRKKGAKIIKGGDEKPALHK
jgi:hypothetical protein